MKARRFGSVSAVHVLFFLTLLASLAISFGFFFLGQQDSAARCWSWAVPLWLLLVGIWATWQEHEVGRLGDVIDREKVSAQERQLILMAMVVAWMSWLALALWTGVTSGVAGEF